MAEARKWKKIVTDHTILHKAIPPKPLKRAKLTLTRCSSQEPDFDGLVSSFKHIIDGLILGGIIENDKMSNIGQPTYIWEKAPREKGKVIIEVEGYEQD